MFKQVEIYFWIKIIYKLITQSLFENWNRYRKKKNSLGTNIENVVAFKFNNYSIHCNINTYESKRKQLSVKYGTHLWNGDNNNASPLKKIMRLIDYPR